jgi:hypothetical protein
MVDFYLYLDEFQNFATESFIEMLSEVPKYKLRLIMAHQFLDQLTKELRAAVFGNVGCFLTFRIGVADAQVLEKQYGAINEKDWGTVRDFLGLGPHRVCADLPGGVSILRTLAPIGELLPECRPNRRDKVIQWSRTAYSSSRATVEAHIAQEWGGQHDTA